MNSTSKPQGQQAALTEAKEVAANNYAQLAALRADNARLREALQAVMQHCVTVKGTPDKDKGRTEAQQYALDLARAALKAQP